MTGGVAGDSPYSGPVTVVFGNLDGGDPDFAMVFFNTASVSQSDFIFSAPAAVSTTSAIQSSAMFAAPQPAFGSLTGADAKV